MKKLFSLFFSLMLLSACGDETTSKTPTDAPSGDNKNQEEIPENTDTSETDSEENSDGFSQTADPKKGDTVVTIETNKGDIKIRMFADLVPKTVENFVTHAENGYYDGIIFHRVIDGFMVQGGDPTGTGRGGESIWGGKFEDELTPKLSNIRGSISMANAGKDTNGSQFFINHGDNTFLDGYMNGQVKNCAQRGISCHAVFGQVIEGMDVVDAIAAVETGANDKPTEDVVMEKVTVSEF